MERENEELRENLDVISRAALSFTKINYDEISNEMKELLCRSFVAGGLWLSTHIWVPFDENAMEDEYFPEEGNVCVIKVFSKDNDEYLGMKLDIFDGERFVTLGEDEYVESFFIVPE